MEFTIVEKDGVKQFDMGRAQQNFETHQTRLIVVSDLLQAARSEFNNAEQIFRIMKTLPGSWQKSNAPIKYFFLTEDDLPAVPAEFVDDETVVPDDYSIVPFDKIKRVKCPGCVELRPLIRRQWDDRIDNIVICGNSLHNYPV